MIDERVHKILDKSAQRQAKLGRELRENTISLQTYRKLMRREKLETNRNLAHVHDIPLRR